MPPHLRVVAAAALAGAWLGLLFTGHAFGGAVHLLAVGAIVVAPRRLAVKPALRAEASR